MTNTDENLTRWEVMGIWLCFVLACLTFWAAIFRGIFGS